MPERSARAKACSSKVKSDCRKLFDGTPKKSDCKECSKCNQCDGIKALQALVGNR